MWLRVFLPPPTSPLTSLQRRHPLYFTGHQFHRHHQRILAAVVAGVVARTAADLVEPLVVIEIDRVDVARSHFKQHALRALSAHHLAYRAQQAPPLPT